MSVLCCENCSQDMVCIESGIKTIEVEEITFWVNYCNNCGTVGIIYSNSTEYEWFYTLV